MADHLDHTSARFRQCVSLATQHRAGGPLCIERIALALLIPQLAVGAVHLEDGVAAGLEEAREARAIGATALDPIGPHGTTGPGPGLQLLIAPAVYRDRDGPKACPECGEGNSSMGVLVGVDADDHL